MTKHIRFKIDIHISLVLLLLFLVLESGCGLQNHSKTPKEISTHPLGGKTANNKGQENNISIPVDVPLPQNSYDFIDVLVKSDPTKPHHERFLGDWRIQIYAIDDQARPISPIYYGETTPDGTARVGMPSYMYALPLVVNAYNDAHPLVNNDGVLVDEDPEDDEEIEECKTFEIFIPPNCYQEAPFVLGPYENALWKFYKQNAMKRGHAWNPSQVSCGLWLQNLSILLNSTQIIDELRNLSNKEFQDFDFTQLIEALQENQQLLVPTRPPICMAERRHNGGGLNQGKIIEFITPNPIEEGDQSEDPLPINIDDANSEVKLLVLDSLDNDELGLATTTNPFSPPIGPVVDDDPIVVHKNGLVRQVCNNQFFVETVNEEEDNTISGFPELVINENIFDPNTTAMNFALDSRNDFLGTVHKQEDIVQNMDIRVFNIKHGNGRPLDNDKYDDSCAFSTLVEFTNKEDNEQDVLAGSGVTYFDLFADIGSDWAVHLTSDGDAVIDDDDYWAIVFATDGQGNPIGGVMNEDVKLIELLGHRNRDFRDVLHMERGDFDGHNDAHDLRLGLRADYELNEEEVDGERAFMLYTISVWDGRTKNSDMQIRKDIANCYEAADPWMRQFFITKNFQQRAEEWCVDENCEIISTIKPLEAAEMAARSQCFSNSRANQRWQSASVGYWMMNSIHGVHSNVIINPGWLAPNLNFELYIQKFDEAVFKGPRTVRRTDSCGQLSASLPTLVEGDRILIKSQENCCDDYDLVIPCVPEFTGFAGAPGIPYEPLLVEPPPL